MTDGGDVLALAQHLQEFAWSAPLRDLAARVGISDVGLKKLLKAHGIVTPPQGYWNLVHAGKPVPRCPTVAPRGPGERGRVGLDHRFAALVPRADPLPSSGPFASAAVPENLDQLFEQELKAVGHVAVPRRLERFHHGLAPIFRQEERRRVKFAASGWSWDAPRFESAVDRRRLRILNAIFMALSKRGHGASAHERDGEIHAAAIIGDTRVGIRVAIAGRHRTVREYGRDRPAPDLPVSTPLALTIDGDPGTEASNRWEDDRNGTIEARLGAIVASIIVAGERNFRTGLKRAEEWAEQWRRWDAQRRQEAIAKRNAARLAQLRESGALLRQADDLRALIARVRAAVIAGAADIDGERLAEWERWASAEADRLDPVVSGQVLTHLAPPVDG